MNGIKKRKKNSTRGNVWPFDGTTQDRGIFGLRRSVIAASVMLAVATPAWTQTIISTAVTTQQEVELDEDFTVTASGTVVVNANGANATATAIDVEADYVGTFVNQGAISAAATPTSGTADATALSFSGNVVGGEIVNSGSITATATGGATGTDVSVIARGIHINGEIKGGTVFTGTGDITVNATGGNAESNFEAVKTSVEDTYGIFVTGCVTEASTFNQSGDISLTAVGGSGEVDGSFSATTRINEVAGIRVGRIRGSTVDLSGDVSLNVHAGNSESQGYSDSSVEQVAGIWFYDAIENQSFVSNAGNINVVGEAGDRAGDGSGNLNVEDVGAIVMRGNLNNSSEFENTGGLSVRVKGGAEAAGSRGLKNTDIENVAGILLDRSNLEGATLLTNRGSISVIAESGATTGNARIQYVGGIQFFDSGITSGSALINSGDISVEAKAATGGTIANTRDIAGVSVGRNLQGRVVDGQVDYAELINSGSISVAAVADKSVGLASFDNADASSTNTVGIFIGQSVFSGDLINSGNISISSSGGTANAGQGGNANAYADASAFGIRVAGKLESTTIQPNTGSTLSNSGNLFVRATAGNAVGSSRGEGRATASAYGVSIQQTITEDSAFINSGNISALATAGSAMGGTAVEAANAYAVYVGRIIETVINEGDFVGQVTTGSLTSTGNLAGRAFGASGVGAGLWVNGAMDGDVILQGVIKGVGPTQSVGDSYAIYFGSGNGSLAINAPTYFVGSLKVADQSVTLTSGNNYAVHWKFNFDNGADFSLIDGGNEPWFSRNGNRQSGEYATFVPSVQGLQDHLLASVAGFGDHQMRRNLLARAGSQTGEGSNKADGSRPVAWAYAGNNSNRFSGQLSSVDKLNVRTHGVVAGLAWEAQDELHLGVMAGTVSSKASAGGANSGSQKVDANSIFVGAMAGKTVNGFMLDAGIKLGHSKMDGKRFVNYNLAIPQDGAQYLSSNPSVRWTNFSVGASRDYAIRPGLTATPSAYWSYTRAKVGGDGESGALASARIGSRDLDIHSREIGVFFNQKLDSGVLRGSLSHVSLETKGSGSLSVQLIGDEKRIRMQGADYSSPKLGFGYSLSRVKNVFIDLDGSILIGSGSFKGSDLSARVTWLY